MLTQALLLALLATPHNDAALEQATWPSQSAAVPTSEVSQYNVSRHNRSEREAIDRAALALSMFTDDSPDLSVLRRWARESLSNDPEKFLQVHPFPSSTRGS